VAGAAVLLAALTACQSPPTAGTRVETWPSNQIVENSRLLAKRLHVESVSTSRVNGLFQVQINALSMYKRDLQFEYKFNWLTKEGIQQDAGTASGWVSTFCTSHDKVHMMGVAPNARVSDYEFVVRFPDRISD
jgi:uncharacterized protein YcfL